MHTMADADRIALAHRNELWRRASDTCTMIGAFAVVALITLPANGVVLTWLAYAALLATGTAAIGLSFLLLRFIDHLV